MVGEGFDYTKTITILFTLLCGILFVALGYIFNNQATRLRDIEKRMREIELNINLLQYIVDIIKEEGKRQVERKDKP